MGLALYPYFPNCQATTRPDTVDTQWRQWGRGEGGSSGLSGLAHCSGDQKLFGITTAKCFLFFGRFSQEQTPLKDVRFYCDICGDGAKNSHGFNRFSAFALRYFSRWTHGQRQGLFREISTENNTHSPTIWISFRFLFLFRLSSVLCHLC